jgi:hypothetical protein
VSYQIEDEDVQLIAEALKAAGWSRATNKPGFSAKMLELQKLDKKLKDILTALIAAKITELPAAEPPELGPKQALEAMHEATSVVPLDIKFKLDKEFVDVPGYFHAPAIVKHAEVVISISDMHEYQLQALVNFLRKYKP